jgi:hypothetical protein
MSRLRTLCSRDPRDRGYTEPGPGPNVGIKYTVSELRIISTSSISLVLRACDFIEVAAAMAAIFVESKPLS